MCYILSAYYIYLCIYVHINIYIYICMHLFAYSHIYICRHMYIYMSAAAYRRQMRNGGEDECVIS